MVAKVKAYCTNNAVRTNITVGKVNIGQYADNIDIQIRPDAIPTVSLHFPAYIELDMMANAEIEYSPNTFREASRILSDELARDKGELRGMLIASIKSALREHNVPFIPEEELARHILDRIIGEE